MPAVSINVEPYDPENMEDCTSPRNEKKSQKDKRRCGGCCEKKCSTIAVWIFVACAVLLAAGLTAYFLIGPKPEPPTTPTIPPTTMIAPTSPTAPPITTTAATVTTPITTTVDPTPTTTVELPTTTPAPTKPAPTTPSPTRCIPIRWVKDVTVHPVDKSHWRVSLFKGEVTHRDMQDICHKIKKAVTPTMSPGEALQQLNEHSGAVYLNSTEEEVSFDKIIRENMNSINESIFENLPDKRTLMWTGCYFNYKSNKNSWTTNCRNDLLNGYTNFCNTAGWLEDLEELKAAATKKEPFNRIIFIVKDYKEDNGCWKLYDSEQLRVITGIDDDKNPRLSFACITADEPLTSGREAIIKSKILLCDEV